MTFTSSSARAPSRSGSSTASQQLLDLYRAANPALITPRTSLDPYAELARAETLVKRVPDLARHAGGGVLIEYGEGNDAERVVVRNNELFEAVAGGCRRRPRPFESRSRARTPSPRP